jgi:hypothetical protein
MLQIGHSMCNYPCANTAASGRDRPGLLKINVVSECEDKHSLAVSDKKIVLGSMICCKNFIRERIINLVYDFCNTTEAQDMSNSRME